MSICFEYFEVFPLPDLANRKMVRAFDSLFASASRPTFSSAWFNYLEYYRGPSFRIKVQQQDYFVIPDDVGSRPGSSPSFVCCLDVARATKRIAKNAGLQPVGINERPPTPVMDEWVHRICVRALFRFDQRVNKEDTVISLELSLS